MAREIALRNTLLPLMIADALGHDPASATPFGAVCGMLHDATLVHHDVQDGDAMRRGRPTFWRRWGTAQAINLGNALYRAVLLEEIARRRERALRPAALAEHPRLRALVADMCDLFLEPIRPLLATGGTVS